MAEQSQPAAISATFPAPPPFYKSFTAETLERRRQYLEFTNPTSSTSLPNPAPGIDLLSLPPELRNLFSPAPPPNGKYRSFGDEHDLSTTSATDNQIQPTPSRLQTLTHSLLLSFLQLTHVLATNPGAFAPTWEALEAAFKEVHAVINGYRPHQARETLILMMEEQLKKVSDETQAVRDSMERANGVLERLGKAGVAEGHRDIADAGGEQKAPNRTKRGRDADKRIWEVLEREVGIP